jgi:hypothetical protein
MSGWFLAAIIARVVLVLVLLLLFLLKMLTTFPKNKKSDCRNDYHRTRNATSDRSSIIVAATSIILISTSW